MARRELSLDINQAFRTAKAFKGINELLKQIPTKNGRSGKKNDDVDTGGYGDHSGGQSHRKRRGSGTGCPQEDDKRPRGGDGGVPHNKGQGVAKQGHKKNVLCRKYRSRSVGYSDAEEPHIFEWKSESRSSLKALSFVGTTIRLLRPIAERYRRLSRKAGRGGVFGRL
ncbi:hypothetical protein E1B28_012632 [Marasmius oreades]|uniref:Uncharacterized protein n=1 Tax=Marasmius oreades TaxID=181124 RepID=A0A9P7RSP2_9AGAR|nr:uncharacterized protein E1B28_012632 [Marasmius oreades]KAG7088660.1 hypothetical protein E1B28_012632 [Marasmius oreades]